MRRAISPEVAEKFERYTRKNSDGVAIADLLQSFSMPDDAYLALIGDHRIRERRPGDARGLIHPCPEMKELVHVDLVEGYVTAAWHIDKRINLESGIPLDRILTLPPHKWECLQLRQIPGPLPSVCVPV